MQSTEIILGTGEIAGDINWVPKHISKFMGEIALIDQDTELIPPLSIVRNDNTTLFACSGVQIVYPQLFDGAAVPENPQLISQPVIRTQHLKNVEEGRSTSFVNYNLVRFGVNEKEHKERTGVFFDRMKAADTSGINEFEHVLTTDVPQNWNGLPIMMNTNEKLWINGVELGESIFYNAMELPSGATVSVSELAFGFERLVFATDPGSSYYSAALGGIDTMPILKDKIVASICDVLKSTTLMAMNGIVPANNDHGYQMRRFIKYAATHINEVAVDPLQAIQSAYDYWTSFINPPVDVQNTTAVLVAEIDRAINRITLDRLQAEYGIKIDMNINQTKDMFCKQLLGTGRLTQDIISALME